jgi:hypothetical protein
VSRPAADHEAPALVEERPALDSADDPRPVAPSLQSAGRRRSRRPAVVGLVLLLSVVAGLLAGPAAGAVLDSRYSASTLVALYQYPAAVGGPEGSSADLRDRFVQGEVIAIGAPELLAEASGAQADGVSLDVRQVGITDVVEVEVTAPEPSTAVETADRVVELYGVRRKQTFDERARRRATSIQQQIAGLTAQPPPGVDDASAVASEYARLTAALNDIRLAAASVEAATVINPATTDGAARTGSSVRRGVLAGLATLLIAVGVVVLRHRSRQRRGEAPATQP